MRVRGLDSFRNLYRTNSERIKDKIFKAVDEVTLRAKEDCVQVTPKDTGRLRASARNTVLRRRKKITGKVSFGTEYALIVHEMPSSMNWTTPGTRGKFIRTPFRKYGNLYLSYISNRLGL